MTTRNATKSIDAPRGPMRRPRRLLLLLLLLAVPILLPVLAWAAAPQEMAVRVSAMPGFDAMDGGASSVPPPSLLVSPLTTCPAGCSCPVMTFGNLGNRVGAGPQGMALGDLNGDGRPDLVVVDSDDNAVSVLLSRGDGTFTGPSGPLPPGTPPGPPSPTFAVGHDPQGAVLADFNGDATLDLAVANENSNTVSVLLGNGDGTFQPQTIVSTAAVAPVSIVAADIDADGTLDLAVVDQTDSGCDPSHGSVTLLHGDGSGGFPSIIRRICVGVLPTAVVAGDFARLGIGGSDLLVVNEGGGNASCAPSTGTVTLINNFVARFSLLSPSSFCAGKGPTAAVPADFNGDGILDIAVTNVQVNAVSILLGGGSGFGFGFQPLLDFPTGGGFPNSITTGDFDGDLLIDLAVADQGSSQVSILRGDGAGNFCPTDGSPYATAVATGTTTTGGRGPASLAVADFNLDGRLDVATADNVDNIVTVLLQAPAIRFSPGSLSFGGQPVGTTSGSLSFSVTNVGSLPVPITTIGLSGLNPGAFSQTNDCPISPATLGVGASCTVNATFTPNTLGLSSAAVTVTQQNGMVESVSLTGNGLVPSLVAAPATVSFGATLAGTTNASPQTVTVSNTGDVDTAIQTVTIGGSHSSDFLPIVSETCSGQTLLAHTGSCTVTLAFSPQAGGLRTASLNVPFTITGGSGATTRSVPLSGLGTTPVVNLTPAPLIFGNQLVNTSTTSSTVTVLNSGTGPLTISSVSTGSSTEFSIFGHTCPLSPATLAANASCAVNIRFTPSAAGARAGRLVLTDNDSAVNGSTQAVDLLGTGAAPIVSLPGPHGFGDQQIGTTSSAASIFLSNIGSWPLTISGIGIGGANSGDFAIQSSTCPSTLAPSSGCTVNVTFTPTAAGSRSAALVFTDDNNAAAGSTQSVGLTGTSTAPVVGLAGLSSGSSLAFGGVPIGTTSAPRSFVLSNTGTAPLSVLGIAIAPAGEFTQTNTCPASLAPHTNCTIRVTFAPTATGTRSATLTLTDNNGGSPASVTTQNVSLGGTGTSFSLSVSPTSVTTTPGKYATYKLTLTPISGFTGTVALGCSVTPAASRTTCTTPISVTVGSSSAMFISASAKNSTKGTYALGFSATFTGAPPASGSLSKTTSATLTVK